MKLIMNADDFGLTPGINRAILQAMEQGVVRSTTLMMNQPGTQDAIELIHAGKVTNVGLHLTLTAGYPLSPADKVPDLIQSNGRFLSQKALFDKEELDTEQVYTELRAQYKAAVDQGIHLTHLDCHHFAATYPATRDAFIQLAKETGLPCRRVDMFVQGNAGLTSPDVFNLEFFDQGISLASLKRILLKLQCHDTVELMCHPGFADEALLQELSSYTDKRELELEILTSDELKGWLDENGIELIGFDYFRP